MSNFESKTIKKSVTQAFAAIGSQDRPDITENTEQRNILDDQSANYPLEFTTTKDRISHQNLLRTTYASNLNCTDQN